jgi:hypothetical protein
MRTKLLRTRALCHKGDSPHPASNPSLRFDHRVLAERSTHDLVTPEGSLFGGCEVSRRPAARLHGSSLDLRRRRILRWARTLAQACSLLVPQGDRHIRRQVYLSDCRIAWRLMAHDGVVLGQHE